MSEWIPTKTELPPEMLLVDTKIDDRRGVRNEQPMFLRGNLWWVADGGMYVYYRPTHWRRRGTG